MNVDFAITEIDLNDQQIKDLAKTLFSNHIVTSISAPHYVIKNIKSIAPDNSKQKLSCLIDYPLGISDQKTRQFAIKEAIKLSISSIDIVMPQNLATNRKYDKIREDVKNCISICSDAGISLRYILEYRVFDQNCLKKICEIFENSGYITEIFTSSGYFLDNLSDNILASIFLYQNSKNLNVYCTGNAWQAKHFETIIKSNIYGLRTYNIHSLNSISSLFGGISAKE